MAIAFIVLLGVTSLALLYVLARVLRSAWWKLRGTRLVACPETQAAAAVQANAAHTAWSAIAGARRLRIRGCSRWPEHRTCGQECLSQIEAAPEDCLVRNLVAHWYEGAACALCGKRIGEIHWYAHQPALMQRDGATLEWRDIPAQDLPQVLANHWPVCWDCHILATLRRSHPDRLVYR